MLVALNKAQKVKHVIKKITQEINPFKYIIKKNSCAYWPVLSHSNIVQITSLLKKVFQLHKTFFFFQF